MTEDAEGPASVIVRSDQKNPGGAGFAAQACSHVTRFVPGGQASNGTDGDLRGDRKLSHIIGRDLRQRSVVDSRGGRNIEQNSWGIALAQKIERERGPA